ncbi:hypothetical protein HPB51_003637 [Rhipicephalus microplus]|uniref:MADF domain-containing protein n=1 Tax=Rhipicephalus microplus TaxID=6941 RepID=A0A9J6DYA9_RHIMP|nr:hypothetical protein HPB51_003637 [Rhipicephalus microplus]
MPPVAPTTTINFKRLIELVRPYPYLYNRQEPKFKDVALKNQRWNMIGAEFGITGKLLPSSGDVSCVCKGMNCCFGITLCQPCRVPCMAGNRTISRAMVSF